MNVPIEAYHDRDASQLLEELRTYMNEATELLLAEALPGLPAIPKNAETVYRGWRPATKTPWGMAEAFGLRTGYRHLPYAGIQKLVEPNDAPKPAAMVPELAIAVINPITGLTSVYADQETAEHLDTPVWQGLVSLPERARMDYNVLTDVRQALAEAGVPFYPQKLFVEQVQDLYPWIDRQGELVAPGSIANDEVRLNVSGYAVDPDTHEVIYLGLIGHKTATRSVWGSLSTSHKRRLTLETPGDYHRRTPVSVESSHNYVTYTTQLDPDTGLQRLLIVDRRCTGENEEGVYLILPKGATDDQKYAAFAARLGAVLPVGVLPAWGKALYQMGLDNHLVKVILAGGDVGIAYRLNAGGWMELLDTALQDGTLAL
jgi:hypothetical protein